MIGTPTAGPRPALLIPLFNHGSTVGAVVAGMLPLGLPILVVDDGSGAETREVAAKLATEHQSVSVIHRDTNGGRGAALIDGYRALLERGFTHAIQLDADGQHRAADIPAFLETLQRAPDALVLGDPQFDQSAPKARLYGRVISKVWVWIETLAFDIRDPLCGFRAFPLASTVALLDRKDLGQRMEFDVEILVRLHWRGVPVRSVQTAVHYPKGGLSNFDVLWDNVRISWTHTKLVFGMLARLPRILWRRAMGPNPR